ncbi:MAG: DUF6804 family protein [Thermodesulfobacteriota bacterium]
MDWLKNNWYILLAVALLLGSLGDHPYGYYQLLRWVVSIVAFYSAYIAFQNGSSAWIWILIAIGVLFNPIRPFYLDRGTWLILDIVSAVVLTIFIISGRKKIDDVKNNNRFISEQSENKERNKKAILEIMKTQHPLTNDQVEQLLGISDATATRYFDELEKEGKVRQVGKTGRHVYYERV